jgi:hypothetical protein
MRAPTACLLLSILSALAAAPCAAFAPYWASPHFSIGSKTAGSCAATLSAREASPQHKRHRPQAPVMRSPSRSFSYVSSSSCLLPLSLTMLSSVTSPEEESSSVGGDVAAASSDESSEGASLLQRVRSYFVPKKDDLTFRQRLAKMGLAAVLSYGWVSNMSYCVTVSLAWYIFSKQVRRPSPLKCF